MNGGLRVLLGSESYYPNVDGGAVAERQLALRLARRGHAVEVIAPSFRGMRAYTEPDGPVMIRRVPAIVFAPYPEYRVSIGPRRAVEGIVRRFRPNIVHVHNPYPIGFALLAAARARGIPVVGSNHLMPENFFLTIRRLAFLYGPLGRIGWRFIVRFYNRCDAVISPSDTAVRLLQTHGLRRPARAVSNGVDVHRFRPGVDGAYLRRIHGIPSFARVVLSTGRLGGEKSLDVLLRAFAGLGSGATDRLVLSGRGPDEGRLRRLADALGIASRTRFVGFVPDRDLPALYGMADVFAIASPAELQ
ncbi:MAG: glycosyltransferase, partial [bacterium]